MKFQHKRRFGVRVNRNMKRIFCIQLALMIFVTVFSGRKYIAAPLNAVSKRLSKIAVYSALPYIRSNEENISASLPDGDKSNNIAETKADNAKNGNNEDNSSKKTASSTASSKKKDNAADNAALPVSSDIKGQIKAQTIGSSGASLAMKNLHVANHTGLDIDLAKEIKLAPDINLKKGQKPQVLIVHTHATECYYDKAYSAYSAKWAVKSRDNSKNMISIGNEFASVLEKAGIGVIHDKTQYDRDEYSGSYERCRVTTAEYLKKYPSIQVVLDLHRDSIESDDGTKLRPIANINGQTAAQIMLCAGSNSGRVTGYDNWKSNFRFAIRLQQSCEEKYPNLARPMYFVSKKYNHDLCNASVLIEIGSEANSYDEAKYAARLTAEALTDVLNPLMK